ncbi:hypothetical protein C0205_07475 [Micrococcus luteus]|nr:hypothetical protein C0205_07475 [Micrococcus luteus]
MRHRPRLRPRRRRRRRLAHPPSRPTRRPLAWRPWSLQPPRPRWTRHNGTSTPPWRRPPPAPWNTASPRRRARTSARSRWRRWTSGTRDLSGRARSRT